MRKLLRIAVAGAILLAGFFLAVALFSRTPPGRRLIRATIERALASELGGTVRIGRVSGALVRDLTLHDVRVIADRRTVARAARIEIVHDLPSLLRRRFDVVHLTVIRPWMRLVHDTSGWRLPVPPPDEDERGGGGLDVHVRRVEIVDGRVALALLDTEPPRRLAATHIGAEGSLDLVDDVLTIQVRQARLTPRGAAITPTTADGTLVLHGDTFRSDGIHVATERSRVNASGSITVGRQVDARLSLEPLVARELAAVVGSRELRSDVRGLAAVSGPWNAIAFTAGARFEPGGRTSATGHLDLTTEPIRHYFQLRFAEIDPGAALAGLPRGRLFGRVYASGTGIELEGPWNARIAIDPSDLEGRKIDSLRLATASRHGRRRARARAVLPAGTAVARAEMRDGDPARYRAKADVRITQLDALAPDYPGAGTVGLTLVGRGFDPAAREATLQVVVSKAQVRGVEVERGSLAARLVGERVELTKLDLVGRGLRAEARGTVRSDGTAADVTANAAVELAAIDPAIPTNVGGLATVRASARGALNALTLSLTGTGERLVIGPSTVERATLSLDLDGVGGEKANGRATVALLHPAMQDRAAQSLTTEVTWQAAGAETRGEVRSLLLDLETASWHLVRPAPFTVTAGGVASPGLLLAAGTQRFEAAGRVAWAGANDARVSLTGVELGPFCTLADTRPCGGRLALRGTVRGTAEAPALQATLTATDIRIDDVGYGTVNADLRYQPRAVHIQGALRHPEAGELRLRGDVPIDLAWSGARQDASRAPVDLLLETERLDLRFVRGLAPGVLRSSDGRLTASLRLTGPRAAPSASGTVELRGGKFELVATGVAYHSVRLTGVATGNRFEVQEMRARAGDGVLEGSGTIGLGEARAAGVGVRIALRNFAAIRRPAYDAVVSGALDLTGTIAMPELRGSLKVDHAIIRPAYLPTSAPSLEPDPTITVVNAPPTAPAPPPPPPPPVVETLLLDVGVELGDDVSVRRVDAHIRLGGKVRVRRQPRGPVSVEGLIRLLRGWYAFQGRRFEVRQGVVWFSGEVPARPSLDVVAEHRAGEYTVRVQVDGWIDKPRLTLSSEPPLDQADVLSVLLFGRPSRELGRSDENRLQQNAVALASGYVMPELQASVMDTLGLSSLEVSMPDGTAPGRVGVGRYVTSDIFVSVAQEFGPRAGEVVSVEYGLTPRISVRGTTSTRGSSGIDLLWSRRY